MRKNAIIFGVWLFLLTVLFLFTDHPMPLFLLFASVLVPTISIGVNAISIRFLEVTIVLPENGEKEQRFVGEAKIKNLSRFPVPVASLVLCCKNHLTGEKITSLVGFSVPPKGETISSLVCTAEHCGKISVIVTKIKIYDFFGLLPVSRKCEAKADTLILPTMFPLDVTVGKSSSPQLDCDAFSPYKAGNDPSETFAIRDYKPGDSLRSIHWKLTGRFDKLMIREASLPIHESVLILFERVEQRGYAAPPAEVSAALGEIVVSLSGSLTAQGCSHSIGMLNPGNVYFSDYLVDSEESFSLILPQILSAASVRFDGDTVDYYLKSFDSCPYSNIIYISSYPAANLTLLNPMSRVTMILCKTEETRAAAENGVTVYEVTPDHFDQGLYQILI